MSSDEEIKRIIPYKKAKTLVLIHNAWFYVNVAICVIVLNTKFFLYYDYNIHTGNKIMLSTVPIFIATNFLVRLPIRLYLNSKFVLPEGSPTECTWRRFPARFVGTDKERW